VLLSLRVFGVFAILLLVLSWVAPAVAAQDFPCQAQLIAVQTAAADAAPVDATFEASVQQIVVLSGGLSAEAPEVLSIQADILSQLAQVPLTAVEAGATGPADAANNWVTVRAPTDLALLQASLVGPDGTPRPSVASLIVAVQQVQQQAVAVGAANQKLADTIQQAADCTRGIPGGGGGDTSVGGSD
jgi:hypothetical protein